MNLKNFIKSVFILSLMTLPLRAVADDFLRGDVNRDGIVNISDVTFLIKYVLSDQWPDEASQVKTFTANGVSFRMMPVQGGTFTMGSTEEQSGVQSNENPAHEVTLSSFLYGRDRGDTGIVACRDGDEPEQLYRRPAETRGASFVERLPDIHHPIECSDRATIPSADGGRVGICCPWWQPVSRFSVSRQRRY